MQIDDETLMALADGELDPGRAEAVRRAVAADPDLQARLHRFTETRRLLGALRDAPADRAGDDPLAAMIRAAAIKPVAPPPPGAVPAPANLNRRPWLAAAASAAILAVGLGWWQWSGLTPEGFSGAELAALDGLASGQVQALAQGGQLSMIASFRDAQGRLCREFETSDDQVLHTVLACREGDDWQQRFAASTARDGAAYRPASGEAAIEAALQAIGATEPLTPEEEAAALQD